MAFWWVNHKRTWKAEISRGVLWSPLRKSDGTPYRTYANMALARADDIVFSFAKGQVGHVGLVDAEATFAPKPSYATEAPWATDGWMLPVSFTALLRPFAPKRHLEIVNRYRPRLHSPIHASGQGTTNYLSALSEDFGHALLALISLDVDQLKEHVQENLLLDDLTYVQRDSATISTSKRQLCAARIGQGAFRKRVLALEQACRVTGVATTSLLKASHIKPWKESTNDERLDGANGLMLAPHAGLLFELNLISFADSGRLLISKKVDPKALMAWHLSDSIPHAPFNARQRAYIAAHRERLA